jgi:lipoprotein-releasing system permease protein
VTRTPPRSGGILGGPIAWTLARRLLADPRSRLLHSSARAALLATTLGVAALGVGLALLTGYREDLARKLVGGNASVIVYPSLASRAADAEPEADDGPDVAALAAGLEGVERIDRVRYLQGVLVGPAGEAEVTLRAAPPGAGTLGAGADELARRPGGAWGARLGVDLAEQIGARVGDTLRLTVLAFESGRPRFAFRSLEVAGTFSSGFSEFDRAFVAVAPEAVASLGAAPGIWEIALDDPARAPRVREQLAERLGDRALVSDWRQLNRQLFAALDLQRWALFLLLGLIVVVATFNVASTLVVLVRERMRDLGVLSSLGLAPAALRRVFLIYGGALGAAGTALGLAIAAAASWLLTRFEVLSFGPEIAEIYFLRAVPLRLAPGDAALVAAFTLAVTLAACWVPAWRAARLEPAAALRYE